MMVKANWSRSASTTSTSYAPFGSEPRSRDPFRLVYATDRLSKRPFLVRMRPLRQAGALRLVGLAEDERIVGGVGAAGAQRLERLGSRPREKNRRRRAGRM